MTYFTFLILFLIIPIVLIRILLLARTGYEITGPRSKVAPSAAAGLLTLSVIAVTYTTPWDSYLIAERIWWYDPGRIFGLVLGRIPIEEYFFFVLQVILTGSFLLLLKWRWKANDGYQMSSTRALRWRRLVAGGVLALWVVTAAAGVAGWFPGRYFPLLVLWALPPLALQLGFGADLLWHHRRPLLATLLLMTLYLSGVDLLAIRAGVWTINPAEIWGFYLPGGLPLEEGLFFFLTNLLVVNGLTLFLLPETWTRLASLTGRPRPVFARRGEA